MPNFKTRATRKCCLVKCELRNAAAPCKALPETNASFIVLCGRHWSSTWQDIAHCPFVNFRRTASATSPNDRRTVLAAALRTEIASDSWLRTVDMDAKPINLGLDTHWMSFGHNFRLPKLRSVFANTYFQLFFRFLKTWLFTFCLKCCIKKS